MRHALTALIVGILVWSWVCPAEEAEPPPLAHNCQARLELSEEVVRLLTKAASHATQSRACVDGPGQHAVVDQVRVCPDEQTDGLITVEASYQVTRWAEGDTRGCHRSSLHPHPQPPGTVPAPAAKRAERAELAEPDLCAGRPGISQHRMRFRFVRQGKGFRIELPREIPGLSGVGRGMTPLDQPHDGACYGPSGPFRPALIVVR